MSIFNLPGPHEGPSGNLCFKDLPGPHDVPFAAPLMVGVFFAFTFGFIILKLLDHVIDKRDGS